MSLSLSYIEPDELLQINNSIKEFSNQEFDNIITESVKIMHIIQSLQKEKDNIVNMHNVIHNENMPKVLHLTNQHLTVIQTNLKEQLLEMRSLTRALENNNILHLENNKSYIKIKEQEKDFNNVLKIFLPYILVCTIYIKLHKNNNNNNTNNS